MDTTITVALVTGACAVIGNVIISARNTKDLFAKLDKRSELADAELNSQMSVFKAEIAGQIAVVKGEIEELRKTVEKHNSIVERTYALEKQQAVMETRVKDLEDKAG